MSDQITYDNKVDLQVATNIANINKVTASDMNEIKDVVNAHADDIDELNAPEKWVSVGTTAPTDGRKVWFSASNNNFNKDGSYNTITTTTNGGATITKTTDKITITTGSSANSGMIITGSVLATYVDDLDTTADYKISMDVKANRNINILMGVVQRPSFTITTTSTRITATTKINGTSGFVLWSTSTTANDTIEVSNIMVSKSSDLTYEPYVEKTINIDNEKFIGQEELVSVGVNQPSDGKRVWFSKSANLFNKSLTPFYNFDATYTELTTGVKATLTTAGTNKYFAMRLDATKVLGKTLNLSATITPSGTNNGAIRFYFSNNSSLTTIIDGRLTTTGSVQVTFPSTIPSGSNGVAIVFSANLNSSTSQVNNYVEYTNVMLQEGSKPYEPYIEPSISIDDETICQSASNNYSSLEQKIGTWTDGKPIYRSVFDISTISSSNANLVDLNNLNIKLIINLYGTIKDTYNYEYPIPMSDSSSNYNVVFYNGRYIRGRCAIGSGASIAIAKVIVEYTKTTD